MIAGSMVPTTKGRDEKIAVARGSVLSAVLLTIVKAVVGFATGSLGILAEALHSLIDLGAAVMTWFSVRYSDRPADATHHYGHGKIENLSAAAETLLLFLTCVWIVWEAVQRLAGHSLAHVDANVWGFGVMLLSIGVDWHRSRRLGRAAKKYRSQALEADALHFSSDILSSAVVIVGLIAVRLGYPKADAIAALLVAAWVAWICARLGYRSVHALLDAAPADAREKIADAVESVHGVEKVISVRVRQSGPDTFADVTVRMDGGKTLSEVHERLDRAEAAVREALPGADVTVHPEPVDEQMRDAALIQSVRKALDDVAANHGTRYDQVRIADGPNGKTVLFALEFPPALSLKQARHQADEIERAVKDRVAGLEDAVAHIEEAPSIYAQVGPPQPPPVSQAEATVLSVPGVVGCHDLVIMPWPAEDTDAPEAGPKGYILSVHVSVSPEATVVASHQIADAVEKFVRESFPSVLRVHVHQEAGRVRQ